MRWNLISAVASVTLVLFAGVAFGAELTASPVTFTSEGEPVQALLYQGAGRAKQPALVLSPGRIRDIKGIEWLSRALADRGYVVLAQRYRDADARYFWRDAEDIRNAISHLEKLSGVDGARIGIVGHSRGAMASLLAAASDMRVRSTVALSAPTDHLRYVRGLREYAPSRYAEMVKAHGGSPEDLAEYYREVSALTHAAGSRPPCSSSTARSISSCPTTTASGCTTRW
jgi:dipeptidyl aminopeptidase/acylaminoacyl peptidase